jgi:hypothetical protein
MRVVALPIVALGLILVMPAEATAHGITVGDKGYIQSIAGVHLIPYAYLGAKHM